MKPLAEMNLVDDFLAHSLASHKTYGEEASRFILECILQRRVRHLTVVSQKTWYGEASQVHGVRLDLYLDEEDGEIFDMEPDNNGRAGDVAALPRRVRFYHSKIDAGNLAAGEDYKALRNVVVIFIATYDPFGSKRMVYTIKNGCAEEPGLPYEDGARTIFLYTGGTEGRPPERLRQLARYMEHSTGENAQTAELARLHEMVTEVKADREVGLAYMKAFEVEKRIRDEGRAEGIAEGKAEAVMALLEDIGLVSEALEKRLREQRDPEVLRKWLKLAARAESVEEFERQAGLDRVTGDGRC